MGRRRLSLVIEPSSFVDMAKIYKRIEIPKSFNIH